MDGPFKKGESEKVLCRIIFIILRIVLGSAPSGEASRHHLIFTESLISLGHAGSADDAIKTSA